LLLVPLAVGAAVQDAPSREEVRSYFLICDRDGNGWISYREARDSLGLDRDDFATFDTDRDGRVTLQEFRARYAAIADKVGLLPRPRAARAQVIDLPRAPQQILTAYDTGGDGAVDEGELETLLYDYGRGEIAADLALTKLDQNGDSCLRDGELELLSRLLATLHVAGSAGTTREAPPTTVSELFGQAVERPGGLDRAPQPPMIVGPVPVFRRLDFDDDGGIEIGDLRELLSPLQLDVSLAAIHATLDRDEDGRLDVDEIEIALGARD